MLYTNPYGLGGFPGASDVPSNLNGDRKGFLYAIDARTHMRIKDTQALKDGDIIRIVSAAK